MEKVGEPCENLPVNVIALEAEDHVKREAIMNPEANPNPSSHAINSPTIKQTHN